MPKVTYIEPDGADHTVEATIGKSVMQIARDNLIPGILGDCGGVCSCASCHVYVDEPWASSLDPRSEDETFLLEGVLDLRPISRLSCQLKMKQELDGIVIHIPADQ